MKIVYHEGNGEIVEKKSRFLAFICSIDSEKMAEEIIAATRKKYWDARHNCYAYVLGESNEIQKASDDGEPAQTAGRPIMDIILKQEIHNCIIIVTRYFGGTLLGTGGLIRAYQAAAFEAVKNACILDAILGINITIETDYNNIGKVQYMCEQNQYYIIGVDYSEVVKFKVIVDKDRYVQFHHYLTELFNGKINIDINNEQYFSKNELNKLILL